MIGWLASEDLVEFLQTFADVKYFKFASLVCYSMMLGINSPVKTIAASISMEGCREHLAPSDCLPYTNVLFPQGGGGVKEKGRPRLREHPPRGAPRV